MASFGGAPVELARFGDSTASVNGGYDLFKTNPTDTTELYSTMVTAEPVSLSPNSTEVSCSIPASAEHFTDLAHSYIEVTVKFTGKDGGNLAAATSADMKVWPDSNLAHSMFSRMALKINDTEVFYTSAYNYLSYLDTLVHETKSAKKGRLTAGGWYEDSLAGRDVTAAADHAAAVAERKKLIAGSREVSFTMRPLTPFRDSPKRLPPGVSLKLTATRADIASIIMSAEADPDVKMELLRFKWHVRRCVANPSVVRAFQSRFLEGAKCSMSFPRSRCRNFVVPNGVQSHRVVLAEKDFLPLLLLVAIADQDAVNGSFAKSPYNFQPNGVSTYELLLDGVALGPALKCDFANKNAIEAYTQTLSALGQLYSRTGNGVSYQDFMDNKTVVAFAMNEPKNKEWSNYFHIKRKGTLELIITFSAPTTKALTVLVSDLREDNLQIDMEGRIYTTQPAV